MSDFPYPVAMVIHALNEAGGVFLGAAAKLGCDRQTVERYVESLPEVQDALEKIAANNADLADIAFLQAVRDGKSWAVSRASPPAISRVRGPDGRFPANYKPGIKPWANRIPALYIPPEVSPQEEQRMRLARLALMEEIIADAALNGENEQTRVAAAAKLTEIERPRVNVNLNLTADDVRQLDDDELARELARLRGAGAGDPEGDGAPSLPAALPHLRH